LRCVGLAWHACSMAIPITSHATYWAGSLRRRRLAVPVA